MPDLEWYWWVIIILLLLYFIQNIELLLEAKKKGPSLTPIDYAIYFFLGTVILVLSVALDSDDDP